MKSIKISIYFLFSMFLLLPFKGFCQKVESKDTINSKLINAAKEIMISAGICALITLDKEGRPRVRVMDPFIPENNLTVWFGTNLKSRKVNQIKNDPRVTLYYFDSKASGYVMIHGIAQIVDNKNEKENRWKDEWEAFYPNKQENYVLIKVSPKWMEVISYAHGITGDTITWQPPKVLFNH